VSRPLKERKLLAVAVVSHAIVHICELSFPALQIMVAAEILHNPAAYQKLGFAYFVATLVFGAMALPAGFLVDRIGQRRVLILFLFGAAASMILVGTAQSYLMLVLSLGLMGGFIGLYHPAGASLLSLATRKQGAAMGIHGVGGNFGLAISPLLASGLAAWLGWRLAFAGLGLLPLFCGLWVLVDRSIKVELKAAPEDTDNLDRPDPKLFLLPLLVLFLMATLNGMCYRGFSAFLPAFFKLKIPAGTIPLVSGLVQAGSFTTLVLIAGMVSQFLGGKLADRFVKEKVFTAIFLLCAPFLFLLSRLEGIALLLSATAFAFLYFANQPVSNALLPNYVPRLMRGRLYGWFFFANFGAGSVMSWIAGTVAEKFSLAIIFEILAAIAALTGILGFLLVRVSRPDKKPEV